MREGRECSASWVYRAGVISVKGRSVQTTHARVISSQVQQRTLIAFPHYTKQEFTALF